MEGTHLLPAVPQWLQVLQGEISEVSIIISCMQNIQLAIRIPQAENYGCLVIDKSVRFKFVAGPGIAGSQLRTSEMAPAELVLQCEAALAVLAFSNQRAS